MATSIPRPHALIRPFPPQPQAAAAVTSLLLPPFHGSIPCPGNQTTNRYKRLSSVQDSRIQEEPAPGTSSRSNWPSSLAEHTRYAFLFVGTVCLFCAYIFSSVLATFKFLVNLEAVYGFLVTLMNFLRIFGLYNYILHASTTAPQL